MIVDEKECKIINSETQRHNKQSKLPNKNKNYSLLGIKQNGLL